jgi:chemotaxis protein methyltransferase CheR
MSWSKLFNGIKLMANRKQAFDPRDVLGNDNFLQREFPMSANNYQAISALAYKHSGIVLADIKAEMVYSRLARRLRELNFRKFDEYMAYLDSDWIAEETHFLNAITTNLTHYFRENHHFEYLADNVIPMLRKSHMRDRRIRVWCNAASTGEEPYSIAMVFKEGFPESNWDIKILATDLDSNVLATAQAGIYHKDRVEAISKERKKRWFSQVDSDRVKVDGSLQDMLTFKQLNLLHDWPMKGPFDVVFCRNVIIYFDKHTQGELFVKVHKLMDADSHLFIGHSESLLGAADKFKSLGRTVYQKLGS